MRSRRRAPYSDRVHPDVQRTPTFSSVPKRATYTMQYEELLQIHVELMKTYLNQKN